MSYVPRPPKIPSAFRVGVRSELEVERILRDGINFEVSANDYDMSELRRMVRAAVEGNATLSIRDSEELNGFDIRRIATEGKQNVVFR